MTDDDVKDVVWRLWFQRHLRAAHEYAIAREHAFTMLGRGLLELARLGAKP